MHLDEATKNGKKYFEIPHPPCGSVKIDVFARKYVAIR